MMDVFERLRVLRDSYSLREIEATDSTTFWIAMSHQELITGLVPSPLMVTGELEPMKAVTAVTTRNRNRQYSCGL
jgi:hypothetical protein